MKIEIDLEALKIDDMGETWSVADEIRDAISNEVRRYVTRQVKDEIEASSKEFDAFVRRYTRVALQNAIDAVEAHPPEVVLEKRLGL